MASATGTAVTVDAAAAPTMVAAMAKKQVAVVAGQAGNSDGLPAASPSVSDAAAQLGEAAACTTSTKCLEAHLPTPPSAVAVAAEPSTSTPTASRLDESTLLRGEGLFLWALALEFGHPITGERLSLSIQEPDKFKLWRDKEQRRWDKLSQLPKRGHSGGGVDINCTGGEANASEEGHLNPAVSLLADSDDEEDGDVDVADDDELDPMADSDADQ